LENYRFTSANQIVVAMKEQGYTHKVRKGVHSFSREGERVSIRHKDLKKFADPKLESRHMEGIIERFNLYKYKQEGVAYRENSLEAKNISFLTYQKVPIEPEEDKSVTGKPETKEEAQQPQQETPGSEAHPEETENEAETPMPEPDPVKYRKELKEVSYDVLFDRETKTYVPISAIRKYAYENEINLIDRYKHGYAVRNEDLRECLANPEYRTVRQINKAMRERGYTIERDEAGNYTYIKGESSFFMERRDLLAFTGYAKDTGGRERERGTHRSADKTVGFIGGKAKQKLINEILGDSFRTERMLVGNVKKAVSLIQNPANIKMMLIKQIGSFLNPFKEL
ncbi:mobilization protein, partial [Bacteroides sp. M27]|nr:mobilization protein [Bacteroides difficilis]